MPDVPFCIRCAKVTGVIECGSWAFERYVAARSRSAGIYLFFIFLGLVMLLLHLIIDSALIAHIIAQDRRVQAIRLKSNDLPPELTLDKDNRFHLFLSHVWKTGQVFAAEIEIWRSSFSRC
jgi:hypothetical protein